MDIEKALRREWWLNHGHDFHSLYGDDGEMQCSACPCDFKRTPIDELESKVMAVRYKTAIEKLKEKSDDENLE